MTALCQIFFPLNDLDKQKYTFYGFAVYSTLWTWKFVIIYCNVWLA